MFPCENIVYAQSLPPKIVYTRAFYMGTYIKGGDSAQPPCMAQPIRQICRAIQIMHIPCMMYVRGDVQSMYHC